MPSYSCLLLFAKLKLQTVIIFLYFILLFPLKIRGKLGHAIKHDFDGATVHSICKTS